MALCRAISMLKNKLTYKKTYVVPTVSFEEIEDMSDVLLRESPVQGTGTDGGGQDGDGDLESKGFRGDFIFNDEAFDSSMPVVFE